MSASNPVRIVDGVIGNRALMVNEDGTINTISAATSTVQLAPSNLDASFRARVSQVITLGDYKVPYDAQPLLWDTAGTGTVAHSATDAWYELSVTAGQYAILQSTQFHPYASGKSHLPEWTFVDLSPVVGLVKRCGYFSSSVVAPYTADLDGMYLETDDTTVHFVVNRLGTETANIAQTNWDDPLDGTGASGKTVNWANFIPVFMDFLWLGGTRVRLWVIIDGEAVLAHTYEHSNNEAFTMIQAPSQPIRYEIRSTTGVGSFKSVCAQVSTEGALSNVGVIRSVNMGATPCNANALATKYACLGIRLKDTHRGAGVDILDINMFSPTNTNFLWELWLNPDVAGGFDATYTAVSDAIESAQGDTANVVTNGSLVASGYGEARATIDSFVESAKRLGSKIDGTMDTLVLSVEPLATNADVLASMTWRELT